MVMQYSHRALLALRVQATRNCLQEAFSEDKSLHVPREALDPYIA